MKNATLFVDFDHVLFNTEEFRKELTPQKMPSRVEKFLYDDALNFLKYAEKNCRLILFTEGKEDFQNEKLEKSGILGLINFDEVLVLPAEMKTKKIPTLRKIYGEKLFLIEDKPVNVDTAIDAGLIVVRVRRGKYENEETKRKLTYEVKSLKEIIDRRILEKWLKT